MGHAPVKHVVVVRVKGLWYHVVMAQPKWVRRSAGRGATSLGASSLAEIPETPRGFYTQAETRSPTCRSCGEAMLIPNRDATVTSWCALCVNAVYDRFHTRGMAAKEAGAPYKMSAGVVLKKCGSRAVVGSSLAPVPKPEKPLARPRGRPRGSFKRFCEPCTHCGGTGRVPLLDD